MQSLFIRILIAIVVCVVLFAIIGPMMSIFELPKGGEITKILKIVIGGLAFLYVIAGTTVSGWFQSK